MHQSLHTSGFMMLIAAPEATFWVALPEAMMFFKHPLRRARFEHDFCYLNRIPLRNIHQKMRVIACKSQLVELEAERFEFAKSLRARVNVRLLQETIETVLGHEHHRDPVVSRVARRATKTFNLSKALAIHVHFRFSRALP